MFYFVFKHLKFRVKSLLATVLGYDLKREIWGVFWLDTGAMFRHFKRTEMWQGIKRVLDFA